MVKFHENEKIIEMYLSLISISGCDSKCSTITT